MLNETFFERLDKLSTGDRAVLKRSTGRMLTDADSRAIAVFYRCHPAVKEYQQEQLFAAACLHCMWNPEVHREPLEQILLKLREQSEKLNGQIDGIEHRLIALLDTKWDADGYMLTKLTRLIKMTKQKDFAVDCEALFKALCQWNHPYQYIQRKWLQVFYYQTPEEKE